MPERSTIYEVARRSGVSTATVSRVMDNGTGFSSATRERVRAAARELGWVPSGSARGLAKRRTGIVGLLFPDLAGGGETEAESPLYVDQIIRGAERAATEAGDAVLIAATRGANGRDLAFSIAGKVDGLVVLARSLSDHDLAEIAATIPVVVLAGHSPRGVDRVGSDNRGGAHALTGHLLEHHGYQHLAFIGGPPHSPDSVERFTGFCAALAEAGMPVPDAPDALGGFTEEGGARAVDQIFAGRTRPDAIVCGNDEMAIGVLSGLKARGIKAPAEVAVTGFDDIAAARHVTPQLTTVRQPMRELGERAVQAVLTQVAARPTTGQQLVLPTDLVVRRSCGCRNRSTRQKGTTG